MFGHQDEETWAVWTCSAGTWLLGLDLPLLLASRGRGKCLGLSSNHQQMGSGCSPRGGSQFGSFCLGTSLGQG